MFGAMAMGGAIVSILASTLAGPSATPTDDPPTQQITADVVTVNGSGCPAGTASVAVSPDNSAFTVTYSNYLAQVGVGALPTDWRKNCQLSLLIHIPAGFTYAIASADYRGFASLEKGSTGFQKASYYHQGSPSTAASTHTFTAPFADDWHATDTTDVASLVYAPCGITRNFNVNTELRVLAGTSDTKNSTSFMTMDSTDGAFSTVYHFAWQHC